MMRAIQMAVACVAVLTSTAGQLQAEIMINIQDAGPNITISSPGGNLDLSGLSFDTTSGSFFGGDHLLLDTDGGTFDNVVGIGGGASHNIWVSGTSTITQSMAGGWVNLPNTSVDVTPAIAGEFGFLHQIFYGPPDTWRLWTPGTTTHTANNPISAFTYTSTSPTSIAGLGLVDGSSHTLDWGDDFVTFTVGSTAAVPEPSSLALFGIGACVAGIGAARRRRREEQQEATA